MLLRVPQKLQAGGSHGAAHLLDAARRSNHDVRQALLQGLLVLGDRDAAVEVADRHALHACAEARELVADLCSCRVAPDQPGEVSLLRAPGRQQGHPQRGIAAGW
jgi:hypothetical protein